VTGNVFIDKASRPTSALLAETLGARSRYWDELKRYIREPVIEEWKYYGKTIGWTLKLLRGKRNLLFLTASKGSFTVSFVLGDRAVAAAQRSNLPVHLVQQLVDAKRYVEGRGIRIEVKSRRALENAKTLLEVKLGG
jgi:hypothetical protein